MGGILMQHHHLSLNPPRRDDFPGSFALLKGGVLLRSPRQGFPRSSPAAAASIRSEDNGSLLPRTVVKKHSKEELIDFFRSIQTSIARDSPKTSRRTRKPSPADPFEGADRRTQSSDEELYQDGQPNLEDMKVPELRELAKARQMRGYSKLKKGELIDRLKGGLA